MVFGVGIVAGVLNVVAGGGSLITLPVLILLGLPAGVANGTNRLGILAQNLVAVETFRRRRLADRLTSWRLAAWTLPGAIAGALVSLEIPEVWFKRILAAIVVVGAVTIAFPRPGHAGGAAATAPRVRWHTALAFLGIGFYGGFIQAGVGMVFLLVLYHLLHVSLVLVNMYKVFIVAVYTVPALVVFVVTGHVAWAIGVVLAVGYALGGWLGTHVSVRGGDRVIRAVVAVVLVAMGIRLFTA